MKLHYTKPCILEEHKYGDKSYVGYKEGIYIYICMPINSSFISHYLPIPTSYLGLGRGCSTNLKSTTKQHIQQLCSHAMSLLPYEDTSCEQQRGRHWK